MSQEKVEKRKNEKKNRAKIQKRQKAKKIAGWSIFGIVIGCILAATVGVKIYESIPKYVEAEKANAYVNEIWAENGYDSLFTNVTNEATDTDATSADDTETN